MKVYESDKILLDYRKVYGLDIVTPIVKQKKGKKNKIPTQYLFKELLNLGEK